MTIINTNTLGGFTEATRLNSSFTTTATGATGPTTLSFPIYPNINNAFESWLNLTGGTGGVRVGILGPSGSVMVAGFAGISTSPNAAMGLLTSSGLLTTTFSVDNISGPMMINGTFTAATGVTGSLQIVIANMAATGSTGIIGTGSYILVYPSN